MTRQQRLRLAADNLKFPQSLVRVPEVSIDRKNSIIPLGKQPKEVWRSCDFLVQVFSENDGIERLSVCRTEVFGGGWADGITWEDLQRLKSECGRGDKDAIEIFPADIDVVNVANLRHLWVLPEPLPMVWRKERAV